MANDPALDAPVQFKGPDNSQTMHRKAFYGKLFEVQQSLPPMTKDEWNEHGQYAFASAEKHIELLGSHLRSHRLLPYGTEVQVFEAGGSCFARCGFALVDLDTGYRENYQVDVGIHLQKGQSDLAKQCGAAQSYAVKYWLRRLCMLPWERDDPDRPQDEKRGQRAPASTDPLDGPLDFPTFRQHADKLIARARSLGMPIQAPYVRGWTERQGREWYVKTTELVSNEEKKRS